MNNQSGCHRPRHRLHHCLRPSSPAPAPPPRPHSSRVLPQRQLQHTQALPGGTTATTVAAPAAASLVVVVAFSDPCTEQDCGE